MALLGITNRRSFRSIAVSFVLALAVGAGIRAQDSTSQQTPAKNSGLLNSLGGILHRELETQTNSTNRTVESLRSLDALLANTNSPAFQATNTTSLVSRLRSMLGGNTAQGTNTPAGANLIQMMKDWLDAQHSAGGNAAPSTNALAQRSWMSLTNWLAMHATTNTAAASAADGGTNLVQKVRDWAKQELQSHTNSTDTTNSKLVELANLFQAPTNAPTAAEFGSAARRAATNGSSDAVTEFERLGRRDRSRNRSQ
jgi:hypothetical protein